MICRLKYRKGQPLGLTIYQGPTFSSLPLEIRNKIYEDLLIAPDPLTVYSAPPDRSDEHRGGVYPKLFPLTLGLLRVNKTIAAEAAAVFYHRNTFAFSAPYHSFEFDTWDPLYSFLLTIGATNRAHLLRLEAAISRPMEIIKDADGTITTCAYGPRWLRKVYARDQHLRVYPPVDSNRVIGLTVDYVSPAIEAVFRILGPNGSNLRLSLTMVDGYLPGIALFYDDYSDWNSWWSLEIPDYVEIMRSQFTSRFPGDEGRVEVLWEGSSVKSAIDPAVDRVEKLGWEIIEMKEPFGPSGRWGPMVFFTLRRVRRKLHDS